MEIALGMLLVRLLGLGFAAHGAQKLFGWFGGYGLAGTGGYFESMGFRPGRLFAAAAGLGELLGGLLIALGLGGPIGPMLVIATMVVAIITVHLSHGFFVTGNGVEVPLLYAGFAALFAFAGYGAFSLDAALGWSAFWTPQLVWIAIIVGIAAGLLNVAARRKTASQPAA
jgi:putative oxidoreductase